MGDSHLMTAPACWHCLLRALEMTWRPSAKYASAVVGYVHARLLYPAQNMRPYRCDGFWHFGHSELATRAEARAARREAEKTAEHDRTTPGC